MVDANNKNLNGGDTSTTSVETEYAKLSSSSLVQMCVEKDAELAALKGKLKIAQKSELELQIKLASRDQELHECLTQLQEMQQWNKNTILGHVQTTLLDPAVNSTVQQLSKHLQSTQEELEVVQADLAVSSARFSLDSQSGRRLVAKCKQLTQENEELGRLLTSGRVAKLEAELAIERRLVAELKEYVKARDDDLADADEQFEGLEGIIMALQQRLAKAEASQTTDQQITVNTKVLAQPSGETAEGIPMETK